MKNFEALIKTLEAERSSARLAGEHDKAEALCEILNKVYDAKIQYEMEVEL